MSKEFNNWAAAFFSWEENVCEHEVESHELAWHACRNQVLEILGAEKIDQRIIDRIKEL